MARPDPSRVGARPFVPNTVLHEWGLGTKTMPSTIFNVEDKSSYVVRGKGSRKTELRYKQSLTDVFGYKPEYDYAGGWQKYEGGAQWILEGYTIRFDKHPFAGHQRARGWNAIYIRTRNIPLTDIILRDLRIINADSCIIIVGPSGGSYEVRVTVEDVTYESDRPRLTEAGFERTQVQGHHQLLLSDVPNFLIQHNHHYAKFYHNLEFGKNTFGGVVQYCDGPDHNIGFHGGPQRKPGDIWAREIDFGDPEDIQWSGAWGGAFPNGMPKGLPHMDKDRTFWCTNLKGKNGKQVFYKAITEYHRYGKQHWTLVQEFDAAPPPPPPEPILPPIEEAPNMQPDTEYDVTDLGAFQVDVTTPGQYVTEIQHLSPNLGANSVFIQIDDGPKEIWDLPVTNVALWSPAAKRGTGGPESPELAPWIWQLSVGTHTITLSARETDTEVFKIKLRTVTTTDAFTRARNRLRAAGWAEDEINATVNQP